MPTVHVFSSCGRFGTEEELRQFLDPTYTDDGELIESPFMSEVGLSNYEPMCIEAVCDTSAPLSSLLDGMSYCEQWLNVLTSDDEADAVVCIFSPNQLRSPAASSLRYHGAFNYHP